MNKHLGHLPSHTRMLMYGHHHASGGASNTMSGNTPIYKKGGNTHKRRSHHADGDLTGVNPITGTRSPDILERKRGGRACHAEGDVVATPLKKGGKPAHRRRKKAEGDSISPWKSNAVLSNLASRFPMGAFNALPGSMKGAYADGGSTPDKLKRGGKPHHKHRKHHADGGLEEHEDQDRMKRGGLKKKKVRREHHNFGDDVLGFLKDAGGMALQTAPMWLPALLAEGGSANQKLAAGGVGKMRKGMLSKSGKVLNPIHARMYNPR